MRAFGAFASGEKKGGKRETDEEKRKGNCGRERKKKTLSAERTNLPTSRGEGVKGDDGGNCTFVSTLNKKVVKKYSLLLTKPVLFLSQARRI